MRIPTARSLGVAFLLTVQLGCGVRQSVPVDVANGHARPEGRWAAATRGATVPLPVVVRAAMGVVVPPTASLTIVARFPVRREHDENVFLTYPAPAAGPLPARLEVPVRWPDFGKSSRSDRIWLSVRAAVDGEVRFTSELTEYSEVDYGSGKPAELELFPVRQ